MRLIDADELVKYYKRLSNECFSKDNHEYANLYDCVCAKIMTQPTAYNVEKVVEELEEIKGQGCVGVKCKDCKYTHNCFEGERAENVVIDKAIEIIRRGGVE